MKRKEKKLLIMFDNYGLGGIQKKISILSDTLGKGKYRSFECFLFLRRKMDFSFEKPSRTRPSPKIFYAKTLPYARRLQHLYSILELSLFIIITNPTVILHFEYQTLDLLYWAKKVVFWKKLTIVIAQETLLSRYIAVLHLSKHYPKSFFQTYFSVADFFIVPTKHIRDDLINSYKQIHVPILVIPNAINTTKAAPVKKDIDCIYCGRFSKEKNLLLCIKAIQTVHSMGVPIRAVFIGEGEEANRMKKLIETYQLSSSITIMPPVQNVTPYLQRSKLFLLTSQTEGMPFALLEAMNQSLVPVCLYLKALEGYLIHNENAYIAKTPTDMAQGIYQLIQYTKKRIALGRRARQTVLKKNSIRSLSMYIDALFASHTL